MNKLFHLAHWLLVAIAVVSIIAIAQTGYALWQTNKINAFIIGNVESELVPEHFKAQFSQAFRDVEQGKPESALERLTTVLETDDMELEATAYYNRGNIHLREAQAMGAQDNARIALVGLAKQDYRNALLINSSLWDARFNLELALLMAPEEPPSSQASEKSKGRKGGIVVKSLGFRVDLP
ncbi:MAG: MxaK protein [Pseudomonadota bacterium]|nr:MxaK protein [Pseudomonadota bacterium]MDO7710149.1 MxaK protein [Pseudomonadota bacterium]